MTVIRLYLDEDTMDGDLVAALRRHRVNVLTAADAQMLQRTDADQLTFASAQARVLYSFNCGRLLPVAFRLEVVWPKP